MKEMKFSNVKLNLLNKSAFFQQLVERIEKKKKMTVFFLNAHCFNVAQHNEEYRQYLLHSDFVLNDGIGVELGARLLGVQLEENLNGTDLMPEVLRLAEEKGFSVFLLGATKQNIKDAVKNITKDYPSLKIAGFNDGYFPTDQNMIDKINNTNADILVVGMGVPNQELFIGRNKGEIECSAIFAVGAYFDFASQNIPRAPLVFRKLRIEWLFRLLIEPKRMWKRYLVGNVQFFYYLFRNKYRK